LQKGKKEKNKQGSREKTNPTRFKPDAKTKGRAARYKISTTTREKKYAEVGLEKKKGRGNREGRKEIEKGEIEIGPQLIMGE